MRELTETVFSLREAKHSSNHLAFLTVESFTVWVVHFIAFPKCIKAF